MNFLIKKIFCGLAFLLIFSKSCLAAEEFSTSYDISYIVANNGETLVSQKVELKNRLEHVFATQYNITIGLTDIYDINATDNFGSLEPIVSKSKNAVNITLKFDQKIIGRDKVRTININYKTKDFATVKGKVLDIGIPLMASGSEFDSYTLRLNIPKSFGEATQISSLAYDFSSNGDFFSYTFNAKNLPENKGITATFGQEQILDFVLRYTLENKYEQKVKTEIALPPDTGHQQVVYKRIEPAPNDVNVDFDGNWLADFILEPKQLVTIKAYGTVLISSKYREKFIKELDEEEIVNLTKTDNYWEVSDEEIKKLAQKLGSPEAIYDYVVSNFSYDYSRVTDSIERLGAKKALANPDMAVCMEFTDTFVALVRALGIPAREHNGFAMTENERLRPVFTDKDVLHSWPEYYDNEKKIWVEVDPTWGNTTGGLDFFNKFDLDHFTSVVHGLESEYPVTVASYKTEETEGKDIEVSFGDKMEINEDLEIKIIAAKEGKTGIPYSFKVLLLNTGNSALYKLPIEIILGDNGKELLKKEKEIVSLPPFGVEEFDLSYVSGWKDMGGEYAIWVSALDKELEQKIYLERIVSPMVLYAVASGIIILTFGTIILKIKSKRKNKKISEKINRLQ